MPASPLGINVIGYVSGNFGLAVAARSTVARLLAWGHPVAVVDVDPSGGRGRRDMSYAALEGGPALRHPVNLFHMNPLEVIIASNQWRTHVSLRSVNICVPFWEMPHLPTDWLPMLRAMDVVIAPTRFIRSAIEKDLPGASVLSYPQSVSLPEGIRADRRRWGIEDTSVTFLVAFDPLSDTFRKNPSGVVEAFQRAFRSGESANLLIKLNPLKQKTFRWADRDLQMLRALAESDRRIRLLEEDLSYADVLSLYASADVMVSLHRAEGLGLHLMEAMTLGTPIIATGWSGNMDFMTPENSCLVGYQLKRVDSPHPAYAAEVARPEQVWAEPDIDEAATWMQRLAREPALRSALGERAARGAREWARAANVASPFLALDEAVAAQGPPARARRHALFYSLLWRYRARRRLRRWKRKARRILGIARR